MTKAISVFHGRFGRATLFHLDRTIVPHAHREGHLLFHICGCGGSIVVDGSPHRVAPDTAVAVNPWEVHEYFPDSEDGQFIIVLYIRPSWFSTMRAGTSGRLRFGRTEFAINPAILSHVSQLAELLAGNGGAQELDRLLFELTAECALAAHLNYDAADFKLEEIRSNDHRVRKSMMLMSERLDREPDVSKLAMDSGLSRPHFF